MQQLIECNPCIFGFLMFHWLDCDRHEYVLMIQKNWLSYLIQNKFMIETAKVSIFMHVFVLE